MAGVCLMFTFYDTTGSVGCIDGVSQEVRRIARAVGVTCSFYMPDTLWSMFNVKDRFRKVQKNTWCIRLNAKRVGDNTSEKRNAH